MLKLDDKAIEDLKYFLKPIADFSKAVNGPDIDDIAAVSDTANVVLEENEARYSLDKNASFWLMDARRIRELYEALLTGDPEEILQVLNSRRGHWT